MIVHPHAVLASRGNLFTVGFREPQSVTGRDLTQSLTDIFWPREGIWRVDRCHSDDGHVHPPYHRSYRIRPVRCRLQNELPSL